VWVVARGDNGEKLRIAAVTAGVSTTIADDTIDRLVDAAGTNITVSSVGDLITVTVTGGPNPGTFNGSTSAHTSATKFGLGMNTGFTSGQTFDNCVLS